MSDAMALTAERGSFTRNTKFDNFECWMRARTIFSPPVSQFSDHVQVELREQFLADHEWRAENHAILEKAHSGLESPRSNAQPETAPALEPTGWLQTPRFGGEDLFREPGALLKLAHDAILVRDMESKIRFWNRGAVETYGWTAAEASGREVHELLRTQLPVPLEEVLAVLRARDEWEGELKQFNRDGHPIVVASRWSLQRNHCGEPAAILEINRDITERKKVDAQLIEAQKMEALGRLAGGAAHDFNNLLGAIRGYGELLLDTTAPGSAERRYVEKIKQAAERGCALTRQLLVLRGRQECEEPVLDLNAIVAESKKLIRRTAGENLELKTELRCRDGRIKANPEQINQFLLTLALNSRDAMPQGGTLTIETGDAFLDEGFARLHPQVRPGRYVTLAVADTGSGIDPETQEHIFEPYFTTKPHGKGTGLGLFAVYGIVRQSGGYVSVHSQAGKGTTFKLFLPLAEPPTGEVKPKTEERSDCVPRNDSPGILVVENKLQVRTIVRKILEQSGYRVLEAASPAHALEIAGAQGESIGLLLTDVDLPGMNGRQLAERLAALSPRLKVLLMSGCADNARARLEPPDPGMHFIAKPFSNDALLRQVREALDATKINANGAPKGIRG